ncbi:DoxX family protein [Sphingobium sp. 22B]|uniref:DoxX family protein n=1 Tax=unclassified Sphingobium TaxID=2611147 RepID=UPI00078671D4|nr:MULTISPECIES: DoxX family protein [unclassified Sphingobium]KXU30491.1 DoxX family protein [Sphingobium sp. AM]KYC30750.1 DoxX family protein [Sphingobium sp. 22B]OAP30049.1 DoxX family protein [Sphingobium sp. 20006FA]
MPGFIATLLESRWFLLVARLLLTFVFWTGGLAGIFDFSGRVAEMRHAGLAPAELYVVAVTIVELGGTALIVTNRWSWLGAGALGVFLALTIPVGHPFWAMEEPQRTASFFVFLEHVSVIGGLMLAASLGHLTAARKAA